MYDLMPGTYVCHMKMPELGSGEVLSSERGTLRIRFASGDRNFSIEHVSEHLQVTQLAPVLPPYKAKPKAAKRKAAPLAK